MFFCWPDPSSLTPAISVRASRAVRPATGRAAASAADTSAGLIAVKLSLATAYSANPPPYCHSKQTTHKIDIGNIILGYVGQRSKLGKFTDYQKNKEKAQVHGAWRRKIK
ncbi:hypothetical protein Ahy_B03g067316 isoform C [Arachis hypogaea]|uniref:Uncharacterized protein n=1 Tax=Arachis hypogaea TaxID=3818 RepID=A0A445A6I3_ARAHY|nr:hypothetical protein Ahy_B03g067316 isoform C [Arachis hypogaea]